MSIFEQLSNNKGTVSSTLGKTLAQSVLQESRGDILQECIELASYEVFPLLERSMGNMVENEQDWLLEAMFKIFWNLGQVEQEKALRFAEGWQYSSRKSTQQRAKKILRLKR